VASPSVQRPVIPEILPPEPLPPMMRPPVSVESAAMPPQFPGV